MKLIVSGGVAVATALAGCGSSSDQAQTVVTVIERTVQAPAPASSAAPTSPNVASTSARPPVDRTSTPIVPDVAGQRLDVAELHLRAKHIRYREVGGGTFGILVRSNWTVCEQEPQAGAAANGRVSLIVDRACE